MNVLNQGFYNEEQKAKEAAAELYRQVLAHNLHCDEIHWDGWRSQLSTGTGVCPEGSRYLVTFVLHNSCLGAISSAF